ncbi:5440_t:CDS:2 [Acaulospora morrowiae]|uniref:5440_t:CDS:1 n=1 Tax=Acaulospora morrowiae TaxID=94023 RepID=A0A9N9FD91_9GLOM|nr:5440_t:CDS:2 [Acaulospora morrowiae]
MRERNVQGLVGYLADLLVLNSTRKFSGNVVHKFAFRSARGLGQVLFVWHLSTFMVEDFKNAEQGRAHFGSLSNAVFGHFRTVQGEFNRYPLLRRILCHPLKKETKRGKANCCHHELRVAWVIVFSFKDEAWRELMQFLARFTKPKTLISGNLRGKSIITRVAALSEPTTFEATTDV